MAIRVKTGASSWANVSKIRVKISNTSAPYWADVIVGRIKDTANTWKNFFLSALTPSIQTKVTVSSSGGTNAGSTIMNDVSAITLTATRYHWLDADGFTYIWQKSSDDSNWENIGTAQSTTNPASGSSSSSITKVLSASDFTAGQDMYFRFKFMATNSTYGTSASSESLSKLISYYGTPVPQSGSPSITGSTTVGKNAFGNIGVWTNSPTSYAYRWYFMSGATSYPLTFSQARSVSTKGLSGLTATITTSAAHGYKTSDIVAVTSMDSLFNKSNATISVLSSTSFSYAITTPTAWADAGTGYSSGTFVSFASNVYSAATTISSVSPFNGGTLYSANAIIYSGNNRYRSKLNNNIGNSVTNTTYWENLGSYAPGGSQWTLQNFSNTAASGTVTGPNYYEGTASSSTSFLLTVPSTDYRSQLDMIGKALYFAVKAYNPAVSSPTEYSDYKIVYGFPVITVGTISAASTTASIPYTQSYMTEYDIDIKYAGSSITGYPKNVTSPSSPISVTGLTNAPRTYSYSITPKNGEGTAGIISSGTFTTVVSPTISGISAVDSTVSPSSASSISVSNTAPSNTGSVTWVNGSNSTTAWLYSMSGSASGGTTTDPGSLNTSGSISVSSSGTATATIRAVNKTKKVNATWSQSNAQSYTITYSVAGSGTGLKFSGNSSVSNPSIEIYSTTATSASLVTITNITVFSGLNQSGGSTSLNSSSAITATNKITDSTGNGSLTYTAATWTVTWGANGGSGGGTTTQNQGSAHTAPSPGTRDGYDFVYYRYPASGGTDPVFVVSGGTYTPTADVTFGAIWTAKTYTVSYNANGGTGAPANQTKTHDVSLTLSSTTPTRATVGSTSYTFAGWNTAEDGSGTNYSAGGSYTTNAALSLFAKWTTGTVNQPVTWGTMAAPTFSRGTSSLRWGWNDQLPTGGTYTASNIRWEFQFASSPSPTNQTGTVTGSKPRRTGGGLTVGSSTFDNRVSSSSGDYSVNYPAVSGEPVTYSTSPRYLRYRGVVVGADGVTYRSNYSSWV